MRMSHLVPEVDSVEKVCPGNLVTDNVQNSNDDMKKYEEEDEHFSQVCTNELLLLAIQCLFTSFRMPSHE